jgi:CSLREA domain-containing protein
MAALLQRPLAMLRRALLGILMVGAMLPTIAAAASQVFVVTSNQDPGDGICDASCTLRDAIEAANTNPGADKIGFEIPQDVPQIITLAPAEAGGGPLPTIIDPVLLIGGSRRIEIDGSQAGEGADGFRITAPNTTLKGFVIHAFSGDGIAGVDSPGVQLLDNIIGNDVMAPGRGNEGAGIRLERVADPILLYNSIGGNAGTGIAFFDVTGAVAYGNVVGKEPNGNGGDGIRLEGSSHNTIGGPPANEDQFASLGGPAWNRIEGNGGAGINVISGSGNSFRGSVIDGNADPEIDIGDDGPTPPGTGGVPEITALSTNDGAVVVTGTLDAAPNTSYDIDFYRNGGCDTDVDYYWRYWVLSRVVTTDSRGHASLYNGYWFSPSDSIPIRMQPGEGASVTATDIATGETSEFSNCSVILASEVSVSVTGGSSSVPVGQTLSYTTTVTNAGPDLSQRTTLSVGGYGPRPGIIEVVSIELTRGTCPLSDSEGYATLCYLGDLEPGGQVQAVVALRPLAPGSDLVATFDTDTASWDDTLDDHHVTRNFDATCTLSGSSHGDTLVGTSGNDVICGYGGNDVIKGGGGKDWILGGAGADLIRGGSGPDTLFGDGGNDSLNGGLGRDTVSYALATRGVTVDLGQGRATGSGTDRLAAIENAVGSGYGDVLIGTSGANSLRGRAGRDKLYGKGGNDYFFARDLRQDSIYGGYGTDSARADRSRDRLYSIEKVL